jgi:hypothetical protein
MFRRRCGERRAKKTARRPVYKPVYKMSSGVPEAGDAAGWSRTVPGKGRNYRRQGSLLALQLALERFHFLGQRDILVHQRFDLAHGVQDRGVIAASEPAADFGQ